MMKCLVILVLAITLTVEASPVVGLLGDLPIVGELLGVRGGRDRDRNGKHGVDTILEDTGRTLDWVHQEISGLLRGPKLLGATDDDNSGDELHPFAEQGVGNDLDTKF